MIFISTNPNISIDMKARLVLMFLSFLFLLTAKASEPKGFPIIADILPTELYDNTRFADIRKAGFNAIMVWPKSTPKIYKALNAAEANGLKVIIFNVEIERRPETIVPLIKDHPALWQYILADEPKMKRWQELLDLQQRISRLHPEGQCYINLYPNAGQWLLDDIGVKRYPEYVKAFSKIKQPQISYDFYPVRKGGKVADSQWYATLDEIRSESQRTGKPFWAYVLCVPHGPYPMPTLAHLRLQCYVNLAYGAQGISYFSYATPEPTKSYDFHDGPLLRNGKKGKTYKTVKKMNAELKPVASLFWKSKVTSIKHRKCIDGEVIVSHFAKGDKRYTCFVNKSANKNVTVGLRANDYLVRVRKNLKTEPVKTTYTLEAGDILIMRDK